MENFNSHYALLQILRAKYFNEFDNLKTISDYDELQIDLDNFRNDLKFLEINYGVSSFTETIESFIEEIEKGQKDLLTTEFSISKSMNYGD